MKTIHYTITLVISIVIVSTITYFINTSAKHLPEGVDMGTGVVWDSKNIGAEVCENPGFFFVWGAEKGVTTKHEDSDDGALANKSIDEGNPQLFHNAAEEIRGEGWRLPTPQEWEKLLSDDITKKKYKIINNSLCVELTSNINGNILILPVMPITENDTIYSKKYLTATYNDAVLFNPYFATDGDTTGITKNIVEYYHGSKSKTGNIRAVHSPIIEKRTKKSEKEETIECEIVVEKTINEGEEFIDENKKYNTASKEQPATIEQTASIEHTATYITDCVKDTLTKNEIHKIIEEAKTILEESENIKIIEANEKEENCIIPYDMQILGLKSRVKSVKEQTKNGTLYYEFDSNGNFKIFRGINVKNLKIKRDDYGRITHISYINNAHESDNFDFEYKYEKLWIRADIDKHYYERNGQSFGIPSHLTAIFYEWNEQYEYIFTPNYELQMSICKIQDYDYYEELWELHEFLLIDSNNNWTQKKQKGDDDRTLLTYRHIVY